MAGFQEVERLRDALPDAGRTYRATARNFGGSVELSVRMVPADEMARRYYTQVPAGLSPRKRKRAEVSEADRGRRDAENKARAIRHARQAVRWALKAMQADHMVTLTYRENVEDRERVGKDWQAFVRIVRKRYPNWCYVAVRERQERGAIHLHVATRGRGDVHWLRRAWWMALGHRVEIAYSPDGKQQLRALVKDGKEWRYARSDEVRGNIDIRGPSRRFGGKGAQWKTEKLAAYMTKYMAKAFEEMKGGRRYWPSKDIEKPEPRKFWLRSDDLGDAIKECHDLMRFVFGIEELTIWQSYDLTRLWFSGSGVQVPF